MADKSPFSATPPGTSPFGSGPMNTGPQYPGAPGSGSVPGGASSFTTAQQLQLQNALSAAGIWGTLQGLGSGVWDFVKNILPKNADGSVDWGKIGTEFKSIAQWVNENKQTILDGLSAYNAYQRQNQSDKWATQGLDLAMKEWERKQPLRDAGMAGMLNPQANTPDRSNLRTQGQNGLSLVAPLPIAPGNANLSAANRIAGQNVFAKGAGVPTASPLPIAPPRPTVPTATPRRPITSSGGLDSPLPLPVAGGGATIQPMVPRGTPSGLPVAGSGPLQHVPERPAMGQPVPNVRARIAALPIAPYPDPNDPRLNPLTDGATY